jgi:hypothetical protein
VETTLLLKDVFTFAQQITWCDTEVRCFSDAALATAVTSSTSTTWLDGAAPISRSADQSLQPVIKFTQAALATPPAPVWLQFAGTHGALASNNKEIKVEFTNCADVPTTKPASPATVTLPDVPEGDA